MTYPPPYMDMSDLERHLPWGRDTIAKMVKNGELPPGKLVGCKMVWKWAAIEARMDAILGVQPTEADLATRIRHATREAVNGR